ncbi:hypothetical protein OIU85_007837 [Salix viminalis]|uniref:Uncharacterized protein n=1 Tax=Salix viminalis TaxID=40686 RepID=A0A9Q0P9S8_SALVM|nr:hypothetical protein OIU85_007837 [Salix viminalis]
MKEVSCQRSCSFSVRIWHRTSKAYSLQITNSVAQNFNGATECNGDSCELNDDGPSLDGDGGDQFLALLGFPRPGSSLALKRKGRRERGGTALAETRRGGADVVVVVTILENGEFLKEEVM